MNKVSRKRTRKIYHDDDDGDDEDVIVAIIVSKTSNFRYGQRFNVDSLPSAAAAAFLFKFGLKSSP